MEDCSRVQQKWEQMTDERTAWLALAPRHLPLYVSSALSLSDSHAVPARYPRPHWTNEDVSFSETMAISRITASFSFPPSHPLPPPQQMDRGESQTMLFRSISSVLWSNMSLRNGNFFILLHSAGTSNAAR